MSYVQSVVIGLAAVLLYVLLLAWVVLEYVFSSLALQKLGRTCGIRQSFLAWIPVANVWLLGAVTDRLEHPEGGWRKWSKAMLGLMIAFCASLLLYIGVYVGWFVRLAIQIPHFENMPFRFFLHNGVFGGFVVILCVAVVMSVIAMALSICEYICYYKVFDADNSATSVKRLLITLLVPFANPFVLFSAAKSLEQKQQAAALPPQIPAEQ